MRLLQGNWENAWPDYEQRRAAYNWPPSPYSGPRWDGSLLKGKTILVFHEQGFGDTIQFIRYLPLVKERGGTVLFACQSGLQTLLAGIPGVDEFVSAEGHMPLYDLQVPLLSLPGIFQTTLATIPAQVPFPGRPSLFLFGEGNWNPWMASK